MAVKIKALTKTRAEQYRDLLEKRRHRLNDESAFITRALDAIASNDAAGLIVAQNLMGDIIVDDE